MEQHLYETNKQLEELDPQESIPRLDVPGIYQSIITTRLKADAVKTLLGIQRQQDAYIDKKILHNLIDDYFLPKGKKMAKETLDCVNRRISEEVYNPLENFYDSMTY